MKNFLENLKDILYDSMDYIVMLAIVLGVVGVIGWRLDILFTNDAMANGNKDIIAEKPQSTNEDNIDENNSDSDNDIITINIPNGSLPSKIGSILEENGLVESKNEFVQKAQEMNLDRELRSGNYEIDTNSSLEDIINIIARQR